MDPGAVLKLYSFKDRTVLGEFSMFEANDHNSGIIPDDHLFLFEGDFDGVSGLAELFPFLNAFFRNEGYGVELHPVNIRPNFFFHDRESVTVTGDHFKIRQSVPVFFLKKHGGERIDVLLFTGDGEDDLVDQVEKDMGLELDEVVIFIFREFRIFGTGHSGKIVGGKTSGDDNPAVVFFLNGDCVGARFTNDLEDLLGRKGDGAFFMDLCRDKKPQANLEIGSGEDKPVLLGFNEDIGEDRQGSLFVGNVLKAVETV